MDQKIRCGECANMQCKTIYFKSETQNWLLPHLTQASYGANSLYDVTTIADMKETDKNQNYTQDRERVKKAISAYKERLYLSVISNDKSQVKIGESFANVGWLKFGQIDAMVQFTDREVDEEKLLPSLEVFDTKTICKIAAICFCDTFWKIKIKYPVLWRWYYYFCHYGHKELSELITFVCQMKTFLPKELISDGEEVNLGQLDSKWLFEPKNFYLDLFVVNLTNLIGF